MSIALRPDVEGASEWRADKRGRRWSRPAEMVARSWATTPGRLSIIAGGLVVLIVLTGIAAGATAKYKSDTTADLIEIHEPTAANVQRLYQVLSEADVAAASSLLTAGDEPTELRRGYENDIAGPTLGIAALDRGGDSRIIEQIEIIIIVRQVPTYAGLVETARANSRQGLPESAAAYLQEASHLMRTQILPAAERLYRIQLERVAAERDSAISFPYTATALVVILLIALIAAQVQIRRLSKRRLNVGLVVATVAIALGVAWSAVAMTAHAKLVNEGYEHGFEQVNLLADAKITALQARADELLMLVARGNGAAHDDEFAKLARTITGDGGEGGLLRQAHGLTADGEMATDLDKAIGAAERWLTTHGEIREADDDGRHEEAVELAIGGRRAGSNALEFRALDDYLGRTIGSGRRHFVTETVGGARMLSLLTTGLAVLALVAVGGVVSGIRQRLREYR